MKLIPRRKKSPTPFERATGFVKLGVKGLAAQRLARKALRRYKFTKRVVPLAGLAALGAMIAKKLGRKSPSSASYTTAGTGSAAGTSAAAAATAATGTPPAENGAAASGPAVSEALDDAGVEGSGPDTPKEAAAPGVGDESGTSEASPPADASRTEEGLEIEGPNQSTPPPPESAAKQ